MKKIAIYAFSLVTLFTIAGAFAPASAQEHHHRHHRHRHHHHHPQQ